MAEEILYHRAMYCLTNVNNSYITLGLNIGAVTYHDLVCFSKDVEPIIRNRMSYVIF